MPREDTEHNEGLGTAKMICDPADISNGICSYHQVCNHACGNTASIISSNREVIVSPQFAAKIIFAI